MTRPALALALIAASACSFATSGPPDGYDPRAPAPPDCTTGRTAPVLDTVGAGVFGIAGIGYLAAQCGPGDHGQEEDQTCEGITNAIGVVLLIPAAVYAVSALSGYGKTGRCREATEAHERWRRSPPGVTPPG